LTPIAALPKIDLEFSDPTITNQPLLAEIEHKRSASPISGVTPQIATKLYFLPTKL
jgi:hypothetical protein